MFLFDGNVCFFTDWTRHFLGVIGYVEQFFAFCLAVLNDLSKKYFSLKSSQRKLTSFSRV